MALPVQCQPRARGIAGPPVRPARQPQPGRPRHGRLGRRQHRVQFRHTYDLRTPGQVGHSRRQFTAYANRQFQVQAANVSLLDLTTGPRFQVFNGTFEDVSLRPFVSAGYVWVNDTSYYGSYGGGVETGVLLSDGSAQRLDLLLAPAEQSRTPATCRPTASSRHAVLGQHHLPVPVQPAGLVVRRGQRPALPDRHAPWQSYMPATTWAAASPSASPIRCSAPACPGRSACRPPSNGGTTTSPIRSSIPDVLRYQHDTILNIVLAVPFDERTTFSLSLAASIARRTVPNYEFTNNSFMFGVSWRF